MELKYSNLFFKEPYWSIIKFYIFVFLCNGLTALMYVSIVWILSDSFTHFVDILRGKTGQIINLSIISNIVIFTYVSITNFNSFGFYIWFPFGEQQLSSKMRLTQDEKIAVGYAPSFVATVITIIIFLLGYFGQGESWTNALNIALSFAFPFLIALATVGLVGITIVLVLGTLGYVIYSYRK